MTERLTGIEVNQRANYISGFTDFIMFARDNYDNWFELIMYDDIYRKHNTELSFDETTIKMKDAKIKTVQKAIEFILLK